MHVSVTGGMVNVPTLDQFDLTSKEAGLLDMTSHDLGLQRGTVLNKQNVQTQPRINNSNANQRLGTESMLNNSLGPQAISLPSKRKAGDEYMYNPAAPKSPMPNKNVVLMKPFITPGLNKSSSISKRTIQVPSKPTIPLSSPSGRSGTKQVPPSKNKATPLGSSPDVQKGSFESVRSKMRESLASAFLLSTQKQDKHINESTEQHSQKTESTVVCDAAANHVSEHPVESLFPEMVNDGCVPFQEIPTYEASDSSQSWKGNRGLTQCSTALSSTVSSSGDSLFVGDELLLGNGLTWVTDVDTEMFREKDLEIAEKPKSSSEAVVEQAVNSPKVLAFKIEQELFKLFGGVNKKYKEKGRSLLFNLKDPNNPVLREKVISGEIMPERLCSMTAEELASEELAQWRVAKAEELAHMIVLPDSNVDLRRLVKKTHKGEFEVEFEQDDGAGVEISVGTQSLSVPQPNEKDLETRPSTKADEKQNSEKVVSENTSSKNQNLSGSLATPSNETDEMQSLMVDELKDAEFLPPIVSLDEFMDSLDKEPPFENLPLDDGTTIADSDKKIPLWGDEATVTITASENGKSEGRNEETDTAIAVEKEKSEGSEGGNEATTTIIASDKGKTEGAIETTPNDLPSKDPSEAASLDKPDEMDVNYPDQDAKMKEVAVEPEASPPVVTGKGEHVWEGSLQLHISAMVMAVGFFRSGEKTSAKEWPSSLEIKGRVRLDAFEKFLQELPMSRSRAVMVVHFGLPEGSSEDEKASLGEAIHSYVLDERVGFAEPAPGVEIYFCPPHKKTVDILMKHLSKDHTETFNSIDSGLIGIVVWRKAHVSSTKSHHKHSSKRAHTTPRKQQKQYSNTNATSFRTAQTGDDEEVPPGFAGFGPVTPREEDDLPEFNFSSSVNPSMAYNRARHSQPMPRQQMSFYQTGTKQWNKDDDDDIPEWQPQPPQQLQQPMNNIQQVVMLPQERQFQQPQQQLVQQQQPQQLMQQQSFYQTTLPQGMVVWQQQPSIAMPLQLPGQYVQNSAFPGVWAAAQPALLGNFGFQQQLQPPQQQHVILGGQPGGGGQYYGVSGQPGSGWGDAAPRTWGY